jgi:metal-responsive CopG/Arc/MetJ family transcriptional regulator
MQRTTITLPADLVNELVSAVSARSKTEAVIIAIQDELRHRKKERIKNLAGKGDFTLNAEELRHDDQRLG